MSALKSLYACTFGPRLNGYFKIKGIQLQSSSEAVPLALLQQSPNRYYQRNQLETITDQILRCTNIAVQLGIYISPIILSYCIYKRHVPVNLKAGPNEIFIFKIVTTLATILLTTFFVRGFGRFSNRDYLDFLNVLNKAKQNPNEQTKRILNHYDFDFKAWPVDYRWKDSKLADLKNPPSPYAKTFPSAGPPHENINETLLARVGRYALELVSGAVMSTFGRRMIYPGSMSFFHSVMEHAIFLGRVKLVEAHDGKRYKLISYDGNHIDTTFVDRRNSTPNGNTLVIGCEGNGGFYEIGVNAAPLQCGYSFFGWNHPGFGGSSGIPYPSQEVAAMDVVMKFAIEKLAFTPSSIIVHGWSIGGFTATWAGMRYPDIGGLIIDASFDTILPLALNIMPPVIAPLTRTAVTKYFDLNNSRHLEHYDGPILLIRRSQDEVIATDPNNSPSTNRANYLLLNLLKHRFPKLIDEHSSKLLFEYLAGGEDHQKNYLTRYSVNQKICMRRLLDYFHTNRTAYPINIGPDLDRTAKDQMVLFLASKFMIDFDSLHCAPLPPSHFQKPWDLITTVMRSSNL